MHASGRRHTKYNGVVSLETEGECDAEVGQRLIEASRTYLVKVLGERH